MFCIKISYKKLLAIIVIALESVLPTNAQNLCKKVMEIPVAAQIEIYNYKPDLDGGYYGVGYWWESQFDGGVQKIFLLRLNDQCDTLWTKKFNYYFHDSLPTNCMDFVVNPNGSLTLFGAYTTIDSGVTNYPFLMTLDGNGNLLWTREYLPIGNYTNFPVGILTDDSSNIYTLNNYYTDTLGTIRFYVSKFDSVGNSLWTKFYGAGLTSQAFSWKRNADGSTIIATTRKQFPAYNVYDIFLYKLDTQFDLEWGDGYGAYWDDDGFFSGQSIFVDQNDNLLISAYNSYVCSTCVWVKYRGQLLKINKKGDFIDSLYYQFGEREGVLISSVQIGDNYYSIGSTMYDWYGNPLSSGGHGFLIKTDTLLQSVNFERRYAQEDLMNESSGFSYLNLENSNTLFVAGSVRFFRPMLRDHFWFLKTDSCGFTAGDTSFAHFYLFKNGSRTISLQNGSESYCSFQWDFGDGETSSEMNPTHTYSTDGNYTITLITLVGNDYDTVSILVSIPFNPTELESIDSDGFQVVFNSALDALKLKGNSNSQVRVAIYDMRGRLLVSEQFESGFVSRNISLKNLAPALYAYKVYSDKEILSVGKFFVE